MSTTPEPLPSLPPSPSPSHTDDVAQAWHDDPEDEPSSSRSEAHLNPASTTRKGKQRALSGERGKNAGETDEEEDEEVSDGAAGYPPTQDEKAESRRIEENLRRWEVAERQRRKAARDSVASTSGGSTAPSLLAGLFRRDSRKASLGGVGAHHALRTDDRDADPNALPLTDMNTPTGDAFAPSAPPTPEPETLSLAENPFDTPAASRTSLNIPAQSALMTESESGPGDFANADAPRARTKGAATLEASSSFRRQKKQKLPPPPPQPLDLPAPREVPPHTGEHPGPIPPLQPVPPEPEPEPAPVDPGPPVRWWHEWLCGCGEAADRGGDHQAGRTNPFE
ncbi:uncharacterized protein TRAVEDRAFT_68898 [Trametes versicolor FP-101664 SS1]|uniref:uncharacterized protein n=1 Tax=Trametes versicolor (strain FP-101664) TaxID=717944 RepID=UPI00046228C0|nr:uncharacterized protein TRAVEDRAFT_68898 [Trametes versicolor FP-101664 SS1]EIW62479.1 hypothetical protein TRAVEDRAFT_68898 [Trametes versicolor FP-101664 SS1]